MKKISSFAIVLMFLIVSIAEARSHDNGPAYIVKNILK